MLSIINFNSATMTFNHTPNAISIFSKGKSSAQVATQHSSNSMGDAHFDQFLEHDNDLYHLTQDNRSAASTQSSKESKPKQQSFREPPLKNAPLSQLHLKLIKGILRTQKNRP